ncbi:hypothetical protein Cob_v012405 [Colletotrichum orbiculare MAFF 240422]|uniref:Uncharacterized protein n=1 Tax=Colletotrichum orbiculare (strain 104-T / ATCC 96160 / CBS 514.97 / LARS 414 / MAFF 240422) TaxID=1213857 RepID=A0A484F9S7_COLOR|nr:hypothetical protein Cob_v012405 [Colletotrichum orbiculare MAFF 240422]
MAPDPRDGSFSMFEGSMMGGYFSPKLDESFTKAGLKNVTVHRLEVPVGKRIADESLRQLSIEPFKLTIPAVTGAAKAVRLGIPDHILNGLGERSERDMVEAGATFGILVVCGQKPIS